MSPIPPTFLGMNPCKVKMVTLACLVLTLMIGMSQASNETNRSKSRAQLFIELKEQLFSEYDKALHPVGRGMNQFDPTIVSLGIDFRSIEDVSTSGQRFTSRIRVHMRWNDETLAWNREDFGNISYLLVEQQQMWTPDIIVPNSLDNSITFGYDSMPVCLTDDGAVQWEPMQCVTISCNLDVTFFPFDAQVCVIRMRTAVSEIQDVTFDMTNDKVSFSELEPNGEWELVTTRSLAVPGRKSTFDIYVKLRRRRAYSVLNLIMPVLFLSMTAPLVFALPTESGEKMGLGITILLAYAVYLTIAFDELPKTSLQISILIVYITILMAASSMAVTLSVFTLACYHRDDSDPVSPWAKHCLRFIKCQFCCQGVVPTETLGLNGEDGDDVKRDSSAAHGDSPSGIDIRRRSSLTRLYYVLTKNKVDSFPQDQGTPGFVKDLAAMKNPVPDPLMRDVVDNPEQKQRVPMNLTWKLVAKSFDSFFFRLFLWIVIITTLICMTTLLVGGLMDAGGIDMPE